MEKSYRKIAYVDCTMTRKWKTLERKWEFCTETQTISYMKRYCKSVDDKSVEYLLGDIVFENEKYAIEYNDYIIENVIVYEKTN